MFIHLVKFIHLLATLGLLGATVYCLLLSLSKKFASLFSNPQQKIYRLNKVMLVLVALALITGTLLVHPKHFTFLTPWIDVAYAFTLIVGLIVTWLIVINKRTSFQDLPATVLISRWVSLLIYSFLIVIFLLVIHDAVTKTTFLF